MVSVGVNGRFPGGVLVAVGMHEGKGSGEGIYRR